MSWVELIFGALVLRHATFVKLNARSDVFYRGFLVVLVMGLIAGAFGALFAGLGQPFNNQTEEQAIAAALAGFERSYNGPLAQKEMWAPYVREGVSIGYEISHLPPRAGEGAAPVVGVLRWIGRTLAEPFSFNFLGFVLLAGLLVHASARLLGGRASAAQMLGLSALAYAPDFLRAVTSLFEWLARVSGVGAVGALGGLVALAMLVWETAIYIKATSVAQGFSIGRAIGALVIVAAVLGVLLVCGLLASFGALFSVIAGLASR